MRTIELTEDGQVVVDGHGMISRWTQGFFPDTHGMFSHDMVETMVEMMVVTINLELSGLMQEPLSPEELAAVYQLVSGPGKPQDDQGDTQELTNDTEDLTIDDIEEGENDGNL